MPKKRIGSVKCSKLHQHQKKALEAGIQIANKIAACGPLGIRTTLLSAHFAIDSTETDALSRLDTQFGLVRSFTRETFRRDELKLKGVRRCIRVDSSAC
jgi:hypothetical protein